MNRRSILKLLGLAPVAAPAMAAITPALSIPVREKIVTPHAQIGPRTVGLEVGAGSYRTHATRGEGPVVTPPMHIQVAARGRVTLSVQALLPGQGDLRIRRDGGLIFALPGNWLPAYPDGCVGQPTWAAFIDAPGLGEHTYTLECDCGGEIILLAEVA